MFMLFQLKSLNVDFYDSFLPKKLEKQQNNLNEIPHT